MKITSKLMGLLLSLAGALILQPANASDLADAAVAMQPGEWRVLNQSGDASGLTVDTFRSCNPGVTCNDTVLSYADKALWDPISRELHMLGQGHLNPFKFLTYRESTNSWTQQPDPFWTDCGGVCWGHGYQHSTVNPANGDVYWRPFNSGAFFRWKRNTGVWTQLPSASNLTIAGAIQFFPEMNGVVFVGNGSVSFFSEANQSWSSLSSGLSMGPYHNVALYSDTHNAVIFGGGNGSKNLYKLEQNGSINPVAVAPTPIAVFTTVTTVDPVSGNVLVIGANSDFYELDLSTDQWSTLSPAGVPFFSPPVTSQYRSATPVSTYGVVAVLTFNGSSGSQLYLYKHRAGSGVTVDTTPPSAPTSVQVQ